MKRSIGMLILGAILGVGAAPFAPHHLLGIPSSSSIVYINSKTLNTIGAINEYLEHNSDLMMRYAHYLNPHAPSDQVVLCPECSGREHKGGRCVFEEPKDEGLGTYEDVYQDAHELNDSACRILFALTQQNKCLKRNLEKLRSR